MGILEEKTTKIFRQKIRPFGVSTILRTTPEKYEEIKNILQATNIMVKDIKLFNMMSMFLPQQHIRSLVELVGVERLYFDTPVNIPEIGYTFTEPLIDMILPMVQARGRLTKILSKRPKEIRKEWVPTSESRNIIEANLADEIGITGHDVKVAVVDTGVSEFQPQISYKVDKKNIAKEIRDGSGHGTHCITTVLGNKYTPYTGLECMGVAPRASGLAVKVLSTPLGMGSTSNVLKGIEYAYNWGAKIISMSLGSDEIQDPDPSSEAVNILAEKGVLPIIANGNAGPSAETVGSPGCASGAISVGAWDSRKDVIAEFSSRGPTPDYAFCPEDRIKPDIIAPGVNIYSGTSPGSLCDMITDKTPDSWTAISGTSMATPHVAGMLALVVEMFKENGYDVTVDTVKKIFAKYGTTKNNDIGWGLIRFSWFQSALKEALEGV